ncbi:sugar ABC transporter permease [Mycoplasmopsis bovigenitalium]|uniref:ABC transporter permease n=1 Tax=Mycoplasmopsis bovigenitalium TaxID=2112 RepID=UPI000909CAE8|nr:ABC transporter permease [Mycoplasmopsis bovigenitalium]BAW18316.1 sugar ABC transporter permease [Mycoplasmopsis bovigenitalium]
MALTINVYSWFLLFFCIFSLGAISGLFSEKVGIVNLGINGMMVIGAACYLAFSNTLSKFDGNESSGWWQIPATLFAVGCASLFSLLHGFATIKLKSEHTISGFAINLLAFGIAIILLDFFGNGNRKPTMGITELKYVVEVAGSQKIEIISWKIVITLAIIAFSAFALYKTKWGLRFRSIGENPQAADVAGINVYKYKWQGIAISGAIAGVAGAIFAQATPASFNGDVLGYGYLALAIMIMGQWNIFIVCGVAIGFSLLYALSFSTGAFINTLRPYSPLLETTPYILSLIVIMITAKSSRAPAAAGLVYDKSVR